ncbi:hypothetical protein ABT126_44835 [Streptomyces sp. NPDC002012]|uniref:hypothetical protein n=1 Tax=Streptomyces sp. NPDC002012 TaxID=3154532 RepID=UPI00331A9D90
MIANRLRRPSTNAVPRNQRSHAWGELYGGTSNVLHGGPSSQARARYRQVVRLAREVFVPLPGRAAQVLELTGRQNPTPEDAKTLSGWADPRAVRYFFLSRPAAAWLGLLDEVWLLPDTTSPQGHWPAAPYLDHVTEVAPQQARVWLAGHAEQVAEAGPEAAGALLRLAARPGIGLNTQVRTMVNALTREGREPGAADGWLLRLAADWARDIPLADRDEDWIRTVEMLLAAVVHAEHDTDQEIRAAAEAGVPDAEADVEERLARLSACRLPAYEAALLLVALLRTAYPVPHHPGEGPAHLLLPVIRTVLAALLQADVQRTDPAVRHAAVFHRDLDEVALEHSEAFFGPLLARAVLDLTAADACAGVPLAERTEALVRHVGKADGRLRDRLLAAHLQHLLPDAALPGALDANAWWEQATGLLPALLAHRPTPEGARLADHLRSTCPPGTTAHLHTQMAAAFGAPPGPEDLAGYAPLGRPATTGVDSRVALVPCAARTTPRPLGAGVDPVAPRQAVRPGRPARCWPPRRDHQPAATRPQRNTGAGHRRRTWPRRDRRRSGRRARRGRPALPDGAAHPDRNRPGCLDHGPGRHHRMPRRAPTARLLPGHRRRADPAPRRLPRSRTGRSRRRGPRRAPRRHLRSPGHGRRHAHRHR